MALGRWGERVASTPRLPFGPRGGCTSGAQPSLAWNTKISQRRSKPARSRSTASGSAPSSSSVASAGAPDSVPATTVGWCGASMRFA